MRPGLGCCGMDAVAELDACTVKAGHTGIVYTGILAIPDPSSHVSKFCIAIPENLGIPEYRNHQ